MRLADLAGLHFTYVSDTERGTRNIGLVNVILLVNALEVPLDHFFRDVNEILRKSLRSR
jgi:transcriptional regulator with XRE-family HTH domain